MAGCGKNQFVAERKRQLQAEQVCQWQGQKAGETEGDSLVPERVCFGS